MAWRAIQDNVDESESLAALSDFGERLYWRLVAKADAWGRLPGSLAKVRARCVPLLQKNDAAIHDALVELEHVGRLHRYEIDGAWIIEVADFCRNQPRDATRSRKPSAFPEYQEKRDVAATVPQVAVLEGDGESLGAEGSKTSLPFDKELLTTKLLEEIGEHGDSNTPEQIRVLTQRLPAGAIAKVCESLSRNGIENRAAYAVAALQSEFLELAERR